MTARQAEDVGVFEPEIEGDEAAERGAAEAGVWRGRAGCGRCGR